LNVEEEVKELKRIVNNIRDRIDARIEENEQLEKYRCFLEQMRHDGESLWRFFGVFLLPQTIFLAFLLRSFDGKTFIGWGLGVLGAAIAGSLLCLVWMVVCFRCVAYYHLSVALAREIEPKNWGLMRGRREDFRNGCPFKIEERWYPIKWYQRIIRVRYGLYGVICIFLGVYIFIILRGLSVWNMIIQLCR